MIARQADDRQTIVFIEFRCFLDQLQEACFAFIAANGCPLIALNE